MTAMNGTLYLEDSSVFLGQFFGLFKEAVGEVVFTTGMVGYPESLTDPSYKGQILVFTYPLLGNYGVPEKKYKNKVLQNFESEKIQVKGVIVSQRSDDQSHWQAVKNFDVWLKQEKIPGMFGIDTRALTQKLRKKGTMMGRISNIKSPASKAGRQISNLKSFYNPDKENLVKKVSCKKPIVFKSGKKRILLIDCGVKMGIIRSLLQLKTTVIQVPWDFDPLKNAVKFDGVVISNGPGDPKKVQKTINIIKRLLAIKSPILGICFGNQLLALAAGGDTFKLKYGHRSINQPVLQVNSKKAFITSQNHGFAVLMASLGPDWQEWFVNLNDGTNEGIRHRKLPFASVQFHPEASPGPKDTRFIFEKFLSWIK